jgi:hypothetical protein
MCGAQTQSSAGGSEGSSDKRDATHHKVPCWSLHLTAANPSATQAVLVDLIVSFI